MCAWNKLEIPKETLEELYLEQRLSGLEVAKKLKVGKSTIYNKLKEHNIFIRSRKSIPLPWRENPEKHPMYGKHHTEKTRQKISEVKKEAYLQGKWEPPCRLTPDLRPTQTLSYILGVVKGDGSAYAVQGQQYLIELQTIDRPFALSFEEALKKIGLHPRLDFRSRKGHKKTFKVRANSSIFYRWYKKLTLPELKEIVNLNDENRKMFLRGFYESEGSTSQPLIANTNPKLIHLFKEFVENLGFKTSMRLSRPQTEKWSVAYILRILGGKTEHKRFLNLIKPCIKCRRRW